VALIARSGGGPAIQRKGEGLGRQIEVSSTVRKRQESAFIDGLAADRRSVGGVFNSFTVIKMVWAALAVGDELSVTRMVTG